MSQKVNFLAVTCRQITERLFLHCALSNHHIVLRVHFASQSIYQVKNKPLCSSYCFTFTQPIQYFPVCLKEESELYFIVVYSLMMSAAKLLLVVVRNIADAGE